MLKKILLGVNVAALLVVLFLTAWDQSSRYSVSLYVKPAAAQEIRNTRREVKESDVVPTAEGEEGTPLPIPDLKINGVAPFYDRPNATFYFSIADDKNSWPDLTFTLDGENPEGRLCFLEDFTRESRSDVLEASSRIPFMIYDGETYRNFYLTFSTLPLMQVSLHDLPEGTQIHESLKDAEEDMVRLPEDVENNYEERLSEDAPIRREDSYATVTLLDPRGAEEERKYGEVFVSEARLHVRGRSSVNYPKNSYRMELLIPDEQDNSLLIENKVPLLGMRKDGDWILNALYAEPTKIREKLAAEVWLNMNKDVQTPGEAAGYRVEYVEVFIDDTYWGLYGLTERIDAKMLGLTGADETKDSDRLYWSIADENQWWKEYETPETPYYSGGYELRYPDVISEPYEEWWRPFRDLVRASREDAVADREAEFGAIADINSAVDYYLFYQAVTGVDNVIQNTYFIYRGDTGKFTFMPWDLDQTFANVWQGDMPRLTAEDYGVIDQFRSWWVTKRMIRENGSDIQTLLRQRLKVLRRDALNEKNLVRRIDAIEKELDASGVLTREGSRWPLGGHTTNTSALRQYVVGRLMRLDSHVRSLPQNGGGDD